MTEKLKRNVKIDLIIRCQSGDVAARERLLEENGVLVRAVARQFLERGVDTEELYRIGWIGFWKAVDGFDPQSGIRFSTCAVPQIAGEIRNYLRTSALPKVESLKSNTRIQQQIPNDTPVHFGQGYH